jgi:hypothetical protein
MLKGSGENKWFLGVLLLHLLNRRLHRDLRGFAYRFFAFDCRILGVECGNKRKEELWHDENGEWLTYGFGRNRRRMKWPEIEAPEWNDFDNVITNMTEQGRLLKDTFLFRGQSDKTWELEPSLYRIFKQYLGYFLPPYMAVELQSVENFKVMASQYILENLIPDDEDLVGWWHLMQHYRVPTRLLDWTRSPYVAAYFAVFENLDKDGAIWVVNYSRLEESVEAWLKSNNIPTKETDSWYVKNLRLNTNFIRATKTKRSNPRAVAQQAESTYTVNVSSNHGEIIHYFLHDRDNRKHKREGARRTLLTGFTYDRADNKPLVERKYFKIIIPKESKPYYLARLHTANISASSLFPGLDGVGLAIKEEIIWQICVARKSSESKPETSEGR